MQWKAGYFFCSLFFCLQNIGLFAQTCTRCHGKGIIYLPIWHGTYGHNNSKKQCPICHQWVPSGVSHSDPCPSCNGRGSIRSTNTNHSSRNNNSSQTNGTFEATQNFILENALNAQLKGYDGFLDQNNCYGNIGKYNPNNHVYLNSLTNKIKELNRCTSGGFSSKGAGVIIFDGYGFQAENVPQELLDQLFEINRNEQTIKDITFSDNGTYWCVVYNINGWFALAPQEVYDQLNSMMIKKSEFDLCFGWFRTLHYRGWWWNRSLFTEVSKHRKWSKKQIRKNRMCLYNPAWRCCFVLW